MNPNEYQQRAMAKEADQVWLSDWVWQQGRLASEFTNGLIGLTDECGELASLRKRWLEYEGKQPTQAEILEECGDVLWRTTQILKAFGLTLEQAMEANLAKLEGVRYKDGKVCNPHDAAEENRDRKSELDCVEEVALRRARAEDDGVSYE